ncbi:MAG: S-methyl-5-thioribose-1-phosphate isomerase [Thermoplasmatales archaeon]|nr:MAG: S-methyl-5-thioribose-1-phosphate isomerase [Thermoplasmatales archaeon]
MKIKGEDKRALWWEKDAIHFIDQRKLPYKLEMFVARKVDDCCFAIKDMVVRGAPAIGAAAAYGMVLGINDIKKTAEKLRKTRPTAHDLFYAVDHMLEKVENCENPLEVANAYVEDIVDRCHRIGINGESLIKNDMKILTHCNAGALATVDWGTALSPFYVAHRKGKKFFVFVDETRPRFQGLLTDWELKQEGIDHAVIADNAAGHYMKNGEIDMIITGADRIAVNGDFANKIGTYEKAVLAKENEIPFYVAAPISTFDKKIKNGNEIVIEERGGEELTKLNGKKIMPDYTKVKNPAFDVTPRKYIKGFITEKGIINS